MRKYISLALCAAIVCFLGLTAPVYATITPTLSLTKTNSGDNVQIVVNGDPNVTVLLSYIVSNSGAQIVSLGSTNSNGYFSREISSATYNLTSGTAVTAVLNGASGVRSNTVAWPTIASTNAITLSQNAVVLNVGSSTTVTATNLIGSGNLYMSNNSNSSIANVNISGLNATILGNVVGSTTITFCQIGNSAVCPSLYVMVQQSGSTQLSFSQSAVSVVSGQNLPITISNGSGNYSVAHNSNPSAISTSLSGSVLTLTTNSTTGSASIMVCSTDMAKCGVVVATAGSATSTAAITFSNNNPSVTTNQSATVSVYGPTGVQFYVNTNSNPSIVQANISNTTLTLTGINAGSSVITVCASTGNCASLTATVQYGSTGGTLALSQSSVSVLAGQTLTVTVSGGTQPYATYGGTSSVAQVTINNNILTVYGTAAGTSTVDVCSASGGCLPLTITVSGSGSSSTLSLSRTTASVYVGQSVSVSISGNGSYYISNNSSQNIATAQINGSAVVVYGSTVGNTNVSVCQSGGQCVTLYVSVVNSSTQNGSIVLPASTLSAVVGTPATFSAIASGFTNPTYSVSDSFYGTTITSSKIDNAGDFYWTPAQSDLGTHSLTIYAVDTTGHSATATMQIVVSASTAAQTSTTATSGSSAYVYTRYLGQGDRGDDVSQLQNMLVKNGYLFATPTGYFGPATTAAVKKYQSANGISATGSVGPMTRNALNGTSGAGATTTTKDAQIAAIRQMIENLQAQLAKLLQ